MSKTFKEYNLTSIPSSSDSNYKTGDKVNVKLDNEEEYVTYILSNDRLWIKSKGITNEEEDKLDNIEDNATKNEPDTFLLNRGNHSGSQNIDTIINLQSNLNNKSDISYVNTLISEGVVNAEVGVAPPVSATIANVSSTGTYTNYNGLIVSSQDLLDGIVQFVKKSGVWSKYIKPITGLTAYKQKIDPEFPIYANVSAANTAITNAVVSGKNNRDGRIVQIGSNGVYENYSWKNGFNDNNLINNYDNLKINVNSINNGRTVLADLSYIPYQGYTAQRDANVGRNITLPGQSYNINTGLNIKLDTDYTSSQSSYLNFIELNNKWDDALTVTLEVTLENTTYTASPAISLGFGNPRQSAGAYKGVFYRDDGSAFGVTIDGTTFVRDYTGVITTRVANTSYNYVTGDVIKIVYNISNQTFTTYKNGVAAPPISFSSLFSPTGDIYLMSRGTIGLSNVKITVVEKGNITALSTSITKNTADIQNINNNLLTNIDYVNFGGNISVNLSLVPYAGYTRAGSTNSGRALSLTQSYDSNGLDIALITDLTSSQSSALNFIEIPVAWVDNTIVTIETVISTIGTTNPSISLGFGNPRQSGGEYRGIFYRQDGSAYGVHIDGTTFVATYIDNIVTRVATVGYSFIVGDIVKIEYDILNQRFRTSLNNVWSPYISYSINYRPTGNIILLSRGSININDVKINIVKRGNISNLKDQSDSNVSQITAVSSRVTNIESIINNQNSPIDNYFDTDIIHIIGYGQSLSVGTYSQPALTLTQRFNSIRFVGGVRYRYDLETGAIPNYYNSFTPLVEYDNGSPSRFGETPLSGLSEAIHEILISKNINFVTNNDVQFLLSAPGKGSTSATNLSKTTQPYNDLINEVVQGKLLANNQGKTYSVPFITWNQGEEDIVVGTSKNDYKTIMIQLQHDLESDIKAITNQESDVTIVLYQTTCHNVRSSPVDYDKTSIAQAQYELAIEQPKFIMSNTTYMLTYIADNVHLTNTSSKLNGVMHGVAIEKFIEDGDFKPIHVIDSFFQGSIIELKMKAPVGKLVFDTVLISNPGNYGFRLFNSSNIEQTITSVTIMRGNVVKIITNINVAAGFYVTYGINGTTTGPTSGARGNLRDSQNILFNPTNLNKQIYNWCPIFKRVL